MLDIGFVRHRRLKFSGRVLNINACNAHWPGSVRRAGTVQIVRLFLKYNIHGFKPSLLKGIITLPHTSIHDKK
jgi:hypothetical protein